MASNISFENHVAKHGGTGDMTKTEQEYKKTVAALSGKKPGDADYQKLRDAKFAAGKDMSSARQEAEHKFYGEEIAKMMQDATKMKEARETGKK